MQQTVFKSKCLLALVVLFAVGTSSFAEEKYLPWQMENYAIKLPLGGLSGNAKHGRDIARRKDKGNCLACHGMPIPEEPFHGTVGPPLNGIASRMNAGQIRLRIVDETKVIPSTIMPGFYKNPKEHNRVADEYWGKTVLTAQEVEDVVAYLMTLK
jgi:sulfur-oxidizing protein SoxX